MTTPDEIRKLDNQAPHLDYYPHWLDNLADDVILQGAVFNGELRGADNVGKMLSFARNLYAFQDFRFYGRRGDLFLEDYRSRIRGTEPTSRPESRSITSSSCTSTTKARPVNSS
jgi:hypothetical protein